MNRIKIVNTLLLLLLSAGLVYAQQGNVKGTIVDKSSGAPLERAAVTSSSGRELGLSAADGTFTVTLDQGNQMLFINFPEYEQSIISVMVRQGETVDAGKIEMMLAAGFLLDQGTVNISEGSPTMALRTNRSRVYSALRQISS